jgi:glycosyltransferase involved in cell wall biosynthesis
MKILQVIPVFYPESGGPAAIVRSISKELAKHHEVTVYTTNALDQRHEFNKSPFEHESNGYKIVYFPRILSSFGFNISPGIVEALQKTLANYDIVHLHSWRNFQDLAIYYFTRKFGVPYVLQVHGSLPAIVAKKNLKKIYDFSFGQKLLQGSSKVVALSSFEARQYMTMGLPAEKIVVVPNSINLIEYSEFPSKGNFKRSFGINRDIKIILYLGRIHESKGLDLLVRAFGIISKDRRDIKLVLVGPDDGYKSTLLKLIGELNLEEKILFTGFVSQEAKLSALGDSEVFVTPCFFGFPVTFLESLLMKCPIVTTSKELDWIDDNVGYISEGTPLELARAICNILGNNKTCQRFRKNCEVYGHQFETSKIVSQLENIYFSVVNGN